MLFEATPEQALESSPQMVLKSVATLVEFTPDAATHVSDDIMQEQRTESGVGGKVSDACHAVPVVGQDRATVLVGLYSLDAVLKGVADAICFERLL